MKRFLIPLFIFGAASWVFLGYIVYFVPPRIGGQLVLSNIAYFLISALIGLTTTSCLIFYFISLLFTPKNRLANLEPSFRSIFRAAFRRGFLAASLLTSIIAFKIFGFVSLVNIALVFGIVILIEIYFSGR